MGPIIPDEAVEAAAKAEYQHRVVDYGWLEWETLSHPHQEMFRQHVRFILAAAYAHDPTRAALDEVVRAAREFAPGPHLGAITMTPAMARLCAALAELDRVGT